METKRFVPRRKAVVSLYIDLELWHIFGEACRKRLTTRGQQVSAFLEHTLHQWQQQEEEMHHGDENSSVHT